PWAPAGATRNGARRHHAPVPWRRSALRPRAGWHRARRSSARSPSSAPIFLGFALYGRGIGVLHLEPIGRAAGTIVGFLPLRDNSFKTELAGVPKLGRAVALHVLVESNAWPSLGQDYSKRGLATLQRIRSEIVTVQFDQVGGVQENAFVMVPVANAIEQRDAVVITGNRLPVDDARARAQPGQRLDDQREAVCEVIARAAVEPHLR